MDIFGRISHPLLGLKNPTKEKTKNSSRCKTVLQWERREREQNANKGEKFTQAPTNNNCPTPEKCNKAAHQFQLKNEEFVEVKINHENTAK